MPEGASVLLYGYRYSVYTWIARFILTEKAIDFREIAVDPFSSEPDPRYLKLQPSGRVPTLDHNGFALYETAAITRYCDAVMPGRPLTPTDPKRAARMAQVIAIADHEGYVPLVRQVFAHAVFRPAEGLSADADTVQQGLTTAKTVLSALEAIAAEGLVLDGETFTLADGHLAPMIAYFAQAPAGLTALQDYPSLFAWWEQIKTRPSLVKTDPSLPDQLP
ncbi:glutathione S-transferase family protein [Yoonia litorea]|uniref:glutathione transferase n=1 Tax=Yoonia litorea TaxID=1123755 RepID=A0A1I6MJW5_9RHOB|nr:glutathione S-transferase family protein [Yoonia litorea]SFS15973.1 glutathione S-transferase [Yoonia litorea]